MACMCGDTGCPSCGTAQGTLATGDEQMALAKAAHKVANAMVELRDAWIDAEGCDAYGHPTEIGDYPFAASLDDLSGAVDVFAVKTDAWAREVEKRREDDQEPPCVGCQEGLLDDEFPHTCGWVV